MAGCSSDEALRYFLIAGDLRISITLSLVCNPLACCMLRVKPRFHFGFTSVIMRMGGNSHNYSQTVIRYLLNCGQKSLKNVCSARLKIRLKGKNCFIFLKKNGFFVPFGSKIGGTVVGR